MNDEQLDQFSKSCLVFIVCMYNLLHGRVTQYEHSVDGGRKRERGCVDRAEFFSTVASISS